MYSSTFLKLSQICEWENKLYISWWNCILEIKKDRFKFWLLFLFAKVVKEIVKLIKHYII